jgi:uncharacterized low-complexity protein
MVWCSPDEISETQYGRNEEESSREEGRCGDARFAIRNVAADLKCGAGAWGTKQLEEKAVSIATIRNGGERRVERTVVASKDWAVPNAGAADTTAKIPRYNKLPC